MLFEGIRQAFPIPPRRSRDSDLTVVTCSVSAIVRRSERGVQSGRDDGVHDGRTGGEHDAPAARWSHLPQSVPLPARVLWTSLIKVRGKVIRLVARGGVQHDDLPRLAAIVDLITESARARWRWKDWRPGTKIERMVKLVDETPVQRIRVLRETSLLTTEKEIPLGVLYRSISRVK